MSKIHYTLYLADCQAHSFRAVYDALELLSTISSMEASVTAWVADIKKDLLFLQAQLQAISSKLDEVRQAVWILYRFMDHKADCLIDQRPA